MVLVLVSVISYDHRIPSSGTTSVILLTPIIFLAVVSQSLLYAVANAYTIHSSIFKNFGTLLGITLRFANLCSVTRGASS